MAGPWEKYGAPSGSYEVAPPDPYKVQDQQFQQNSEVRAQTDQALQLEKAQRERLEWNATHNPDGTTKAGTGDAKLTVDERTAAFLATRVAGGMKDLDAVLGQSPGAAKPSIFANIAGMFGDDARNAANSPERQRIEAAQLDILDAALTLGTGAAYTKEQLAGYSRSYFPQIGDNPATIADKQNRLKRLLEAAKVKAGSAAPQIDEALARLGENQAASAAGPGASAGGAAGRLIGEQQAEFFRILETQGKDAADAYLQSFGYRMADPSQADKPHSNAFDYSGADAQAQARIDALRQEQGDGAGSALRRGAADGLFLGAADEIRAGARALDGALKGQGSIGDLYSQNLQAEQGYQGQLQSEHPFAYGGGQLAGGLIPGAVTFGASTPGQIARVGAGVGGVYGFNSGEGGLENRLASGVEGAGAGAALGYAIPKGVQLWKGRQRPPVPELVDPTTGELNNVLDAMKPAERYQSLKDAGISNPTPGMVGGRSARIIEQGFNNLPGSAGIMEDINNAASKELRTAADGVADQFGSSRTLNEAGGELQRGAQERIARGERAIDRAYNAIPIAPTANASTTSTKATLQALTSRFQSNPDLADALKDPSLVRYLGAVDKGLSWQDLKDFRSIIGEKIGNARIGESSSVSDLRALYAGLTEDMKNTAASMGPGVLRSFERANNLYRNEQQLIENSLVKLLGKDGSLSAERAADAVKKMTAGGKAAGDLKTLAQIKAATVKSGAWDEIAATLIRLGGQPSDSQGRAFQPDTFVRWYADMAEPARAMLFKPELRKALNNFVAANQQIAGLKGLANTSKSAPVVFGGSALLTAGAAVTNPLLGAKLAAVLGGNYVLGKLWTWPAFVQWATGYSRAVASGAPGAVRSQIGRLSKLASTNPELRDPIQKLISSIANDNMAPGIAASQPDQDQQSQ